MTKEQRADVLFFKREKSQDLYGLMGGGTVVPVEFESKQAAKTRHNKEAILNAAVYLVQRHGSDKLTVKNVCDQAKVSNGSFYHLFSSKEDLVYYYLAYAFQRYLEEHPTSEKVEDAAKGIHELYRSYLNVCEEAGPEFISLVYSTSNKSLNFRQRPDDQSIIMDAVIECLRAGIESGEFASDLDIDRAKLDISSCVTGVVFYWCVFAGRDMDLVSEALYLLDIYLDSIRA